MIFGIALLVFGPEKRPELDKGLGEGIRGFLSVMKEREVRSKTPRVADHDFIPMTLILCTGEHLM